tara:strand:+ start:19 stop:696 length:678 start_codon:yes stop_codon:yes gene_type:complete
MNDKHVVFVIVGIVVLVTLGMFFRGAISDFKGEEKEENYRRVIAWSEYGDTTSITLLAGQRAELYKPAGYCVKYTGKHELKIVEVNVIESHFTVEALKTYRFDFTKIPYDTCFKILDDLTRNIFKAHPRGIGYFLSGDYTIPFATHYRRWTPKFSISRRCDRYALPKNNGNYKLQFMSKNDRSQEYDTWNDWYEGQPHPNSYYFKFFPLKHFSGDATIYLWCNDR